MITHDVDEAILLADRILLMSNGPDACVAEVVQNTITKPRDRHSLARPEQPPLVCPGMADSPSAKVITLRRGEAQ
jgi:ABC-type nitrate/sulfonate/bicarbonate transport system ATPase subunit